MKILHIATHLNTGGITTYLLTLVKEQVKAGNEVYVWASSGVRVEAFRACCKEVICDVPRCKSELSPKLWAQLPKLITFLKKEKIEIIHTHTRVAQVLSTVATFFTKIPYISTAHMFYKRRLGRRLFPCWGKTVLAISNTMKKGLVDIFGEKMLPPIVVVRNGIDIGRLKTKVEKTDRDVTRKAYGYSAEHLVVLALSRLIPVKGVHILIEAFALAYKEVPQLRLLIAGTGESQYIQELQKRTLELGIQDVVNFLGNVTEVEKPFKAVDIFAGPYLWPEAFGLSILEAMAAGLPVIGSDSGGISELLGFGKYGLLFEEGNVPELAQCLLNYAKDSEFRSRMAQAAADAAMDYSSEKMCAQTQRVYEEVLGKSR